MKTIHLLITLVCTAVFGHPAIAAPGDLDLTFGGTGKVTTAIGSRIDEGKSVAVQEGGKIVVAGSSYNGSDNDFALARYNADGSLDTTFNGTGKVTTAIGNGSAGHSVVVQNNGKIVVAGSADGGPSTFAVVRYNANGSLDTTFNGTGKVTTTVGNSSAGGSSVAVQTDEKIVVAGLAYAGGSTPIVAVVRYNVNGTLDTTFNGTGKVTTDVGEFGQSSADSVAVTSDGKIVVAGYTAVGSDNYRSLQSAGTLELYWLASADEQRTCCGLA